MKHANKKKSALRNGINGLHGTRRIKTEKRGGLKQLSADAQSISIRQMEFFVGGNIVKTERRALRGGPEPTRKSVSTERGNTAQGLSLSF